MSLGLMFLGVFAALVWMSYRAAPETRSRSERLRSTVRLRNEAASFAGALGALGLLGGMAASLNFIAYLGGALVMVALSIGWCADRRERQADALERQGE